MKLSESIIDIMLKAGEEVLPTRWGNWEYHHENYTLQYVDEGQWIYEIDLDRCTTSAALLDWIMQIQQKTWANPVDLRDLLKAIDDLLYPQANYCPLATKGNRMGRTVNVQRILNRRYRKAFMP